MFFSEGHKIFILISLLMVVIGVGICEKKKIPTDRVIWICFFIGLICELLKILMVIKMVPLVELVIENGTITYKNIGKNYPYIETSHIPYQLCSLQIIFFFLARVVKNEKWKRRIYSLIYATALVGGLLAIFLSSIAPDFKSTSEFLLSIRAWEFYIYHGMIIVVAIVIARDKKCDLRFADAKWTCIIVFMLDIFSIYINSLLSVPLYDKEVLIGLTHSVNFFSSYEHPLGINFTTKTQYLFYLLTRFLFVLTLIIVIYLPFLKREKGNINKDEVPNG